MKVILIDDVLSITNFISVRCDHPAALAKQIHENYRDADLFIINVNYKAEGITRFQNSGILLLKYLRLYLLHQHCILYSFFSRDQLVKQNPHNFILFSEGITFIRLPCNFRRINYAGLEKKKAPEDLSNYLKAESKLPDDRHFFANWWGALRIWNIQWRVEDMDYQNSRPIYDEIFRNAEPEINSYQGKLAMYLYNKTESLPKDPLQRYEDEIKNVFKKLRESNPRVIFIDDHAGLGWSGVLQRMIYGRKNEERFQVINPLDKSIKELTKEIVGAIRSFNPHVIILDLRLKGEKGTIDDFSSISGTKVLSGIPKVYRNCPILLFSATNKVEVFRGTFKKGVSAFWTKEGLDERLSSYGSYLNYVQLLNLIYVLTQSEEFDFYCYFIKMLNQIRIRENSFWWETSDWVNEKERVNKTAPLRREDVLIILQNASDMIENYLRVAILTQERFFHLRMAEQFPSLIILMLSSIIERIHSVDNNPDRFSLVVLMERQFSRRYYKWEGLLSIRNRSAHKYNLSLEDMKKFLGLFFDYLNDYRK